MANATTSRTGGNFVLPHACGFTLIEVAVVLFIITLLMGAFLVPLATQVAQRKTGDTQKMLDDIKEALLGYAIANGRLPCPAVPDTTGVESPAGGGVCTNAYNGLVPAATLGLATTDAQGYAIDAWGTRIRYAVTTWSSGAITSAFTSANGMRNATLTALAPDLNVCATSTGITATTCGTTAPVLTASAPAVIFSLGPDWVTCPTSTGIDISKCGADEKANLNNDQVFVSRVRSDSSNPNGEFDDIVTWLSGNVLISRMVAAGQLP